MDLRSEVLQRLTDEWNHAWEHGVRTKHPRNRLQDMNADELLTHISAILSPHYNTNYYGCQEMIFMKVYTKRGKFRAEDASGTRFKRMKGSKTWLFKNAGSSHWFALMNASITIIELDELYDKWKRTK